MIVEVKVIDRLFKTGLCLLTTCTVLYVYAFNVNNHSNGLKGDQNNIVWLDLAVENLNVLQSKEYNYFARNLKKIQGVESLLISIEKDSNGIVPKEYILGTIFAESRAKPDALNKRTKALGLTQVTPVGLKGLQQSISRYKWICNSRNDKKLKAALKCSSDYIARVKEGYPLIIKLTANTGINYYNLTNPKVSIRVAAAISIINAIELSRGKSIQTYYDPQMVYRGLIAY
ncbi:MAG: hypothetical protein KAX15_03935, partial [Candidatus Omnitrophica bacterium]|nr:hypothetical protein [Candidatus Omnitrophota bacterium]